MQGASWPSLLEHACIRELDGNFAHVRLFPNCPFQLWGPEKFAILVQPAFLCRAPSALGHGTGFAVTWNRAGRPRDRFWRYLELGRSSAGPVLALPGGPQLVQLRGAQKDVTRLCPHALVLTTGM